MAKYVRTFGEIPGYPEGWQPRTGKREELRLAGLHAHNVAGISGTAKEGADAIVLNGGYPDDRDYGDVIIYTGHGGQDPRTKKQIAHQTLNDSGNAGLVKSELDKLPVRVIRGFEEKSPHAPLTGYRYDGLYRVIRHWFKERYDGFRVCQFLMIKIGSTYDAGDLQSPAEANIGELLEVLDDQAKPASRTTSTVNKINRRAELVKKVKDLYENHCQICGNTVELPSGPSSEAAHIQALGIPHNGPDTLDNILCLCPNDHKRFDNGALYLTDDLRIVNAIKGTIEGQIRRHREHRIEIAYVRYHRSCWEISE
ncbi:YDG/SRA domain-containing protein [Streptosporangium sandarakinum]|uniref:Putative restriction endonuclease n=1 Tax=Streptosporangium sandarakinum TaxID=1260955 RepID=A0A852VA66_9ACTN|nr:YDG/SRA domain-containing protein [Streptosporangium sandarakinum]NYF43005.1 putative restriction endonuclease [Streptosporangium sandarakinum]